MILDKKGYLFYIESIRSRFGNILTTIENIMLLAKNTESMAKICRVKCQYDIINISIPIIFDFRNKKNNNCNEVISHRQDFITKHPYNKKMFIDNDKWCLNQIYNMIKKEKPKSNLKDDTLILNIRGGRDIFKKKRNKSINGEYFQPPFSYYKHIIENSNHSDIMIVTDSMSYNPVIPMLLSWRPNLKICDSDLDTQVNIMLNAKHLVTARSTFSLFLSRLSMNLKSIYYWYDDNWKWNEWFPTKENCLSKDAKIIKYYSDNYINIGKWEASNEQIDLMKNYSEERLNYEIC